MAKVSTSRHIAAPIEQVFDACVDVEHWAEYIQAIQRVEMVTSGPVREGTRFRETRIMFKKEATEEMEFTALERPHSFTLEAQSCGTQYTTIHSFVSEGSGTKVTVDFEAKPISFLAKLFMPLSGLMLKACSKMFARDLDDMRAVLEQESKPDTGEATVRVASSGT